MQKMANALGVSLKSLFEPMDDIEGYIRVGEQLFLFNSRKELERIFADNPINLL